VKQSSGNKGWSLPTDDKSLLALVERLHKIGRICNIYSWIYGPALLIGSYVLFGVFSDKIYVAIIILLLPMAGYYLWKILAYPLQARKMMAASAEDYLYATQDYEWWKSSHNLKYLKSSLHFLEHGEKALKNIPLYQELRESVEADIKAEKGPGL
jgi:hypothetical protein